LASNLAQQPGLTVVGQIGLSPELASSVEAYQPGALVWDLGWDMDVSLELMAGLTTGNAPAETVPVLALLPDASRASDVWAAGARGLMLRDAGPVRIYSGLLSLGQGLATQALKLLAEGLSNKTMADRLGISENTVKFHINSIMGKLGARSRTEAVSLAVRAGLVLL